ncbi:MAG: Proline-specific peptidase [candidate division TM6 bacterium GW2011_GWF2_37_49]|nr:MAG: Proline-specific peptidase [candidate division TM6 bacterium GW2011_GWF2_37_49]
MVLSTADPFGGNAGLYTGIGPQYNRAAQFISQKEFDAWADLEKKAKEGKLTSLQMSYNRFLSGYWKFAFYHKPPETALIRQLYHGFIQAPGFRDTMISEIAKINLQGKFDDFDIPTLILEGKLDVLWGDMDRVAIMRKQHPRAQLEIFEKSGHMIFVDEPEKFFPLLKSFLKKISPSQNNLQTGQSTNMARASYGR